jgi:membrane protein DedA with SNARE-associated domain
MPAARFAVWQVTGGVAWTTSITLVGYAAGRTAPGLERYLPAFLLLAALSFPVTGCFGYLLVRMRAGRLLARSPITTPHIFDKETADR